MAVSLSAVKTLIGISAALYDDELSMLISAGESDLKLSGIKYYQSEDPLILNAIVCYCQANRGTDAGKREGFARMYLSQKRNLGLAAQYTEGIV